MVLRVRRGANDKYSVKSREDGDVEGYLGA